LFVFGITYRFTRGQGEFLSLQQYNLERGKVGKGGRDRNEGYGKWVEPADLPTPHVIKDLYCSLSAL